MYIVLCSTLKGDFMFCLNCNKKTKNPKFCSCSCSASHNNKLKPKRKLTNLCKKCKAPIHSEKTYCKECWGKNFNKDITLKDASIRYKDGHRCNAYGLVRCRARTLAKKYGWNCCCICGYDKHIEIAHIKPISSFANNIRLSKINNRDNLIALCPNHHWEFDNKIISLKDL